MFNLCTRCTDFVASTRARAVCPYTGPGGIRATGKYCELVLLFEEKNKNNNVLLPKKTIIIVINGISRTRHRHFRTGLREQSACVIMNYKYLRVRTVRKHLFGIKRITMKKLRTPTNGDGRVNVRFHTSHAVVLRGGRVQRKYTHPSLKNKILCAKINSDRVHYFA